MANTTGKKFGGRKKGTPNKDTKALRERITALLEETWEDFIKDLEKLTPKERIDTFTRLLEYSLPKLSRTENILDTSEIEEPQDLSILTDEELDWLEKISRKLNG